MISSNSQKVLSIVFIAFLLTASCRFWQSDSGNSNAPNSESEIQTNIPFSTKEPQVFQAEIIISNSLDGKRIEQKYFVAKNEDKDLTIFGVGNIEELSILNLSENETFVISHSAKTYKKINSTANPSVDSSNQWKSFLTTKWLNQKNSAKFEKVDTENNLTKYLVKLEDSITSEVLIFIDEKIPFPVKQEFYSISDSEKVLTMSFEIKNYKTEVEDKLFELPKNYKEIN